MTPTRQLWQKQSGARGAAIEIFSTRVLEPASARGLFLTGVSTMVGPVRRRKADTSESTATCQSATAGDPAAEEVIRETLDLLAYWLGSIIDLLEPEVIVMGGGVSTMLAPFLNEIRERWRGACLNPTPMEIPLVLARYGEDAGIAGAAALCELD